MLADYLPFISPSVCQALERELKNLDGYQLRDKRQQLVYNLQRNHEYLLQTYEPKALVKLNNESLAENIHNQVVKENALKLAAYTSLLETKFGDNESRTIFCTKCGVKSTVTWNTKQTRGADEGSTIFCVCEGCKTRWKM
jgi:DNA-directed RNA polymerase subunit M/transcription elongation factor TFIIS